MTASSSGSWYRDFYLRLLYRLVSFASMVGLMTLGAGLGRDAAPDWGALPGGLLGLILGGTLVVLVERAFPALRRRPVVDPSSSSAVSEAPDPSRRGAPGR